VWFKGFVWGGFDSKKVGSIVTRWSNEMSSISLMYITRRRRNGIGVCLGERREEIARKDKDSLVRLQSGSISLPPRLGWGCLLAIIINPHPRRREMNVTRCYDDGLMMMMDEAEAGRARDTPRAKGD